MKKILLFLLFSCFMTTAFATENAAIKEETTPPSAEGPITPAQIPSITSTAAPTPPPAQK